MVVATVAALTVEQTLLAIGVLHWFVGLDTGVRRFGLQEPSRVLSVLTLALMGAAFLLFVTWFGRAYTNVLAFGVPLPRRRWWGVGAFVIPVLSFFVPYELTSFTWRATTGRSARFVGWWWAAALLSVLPPSFVVQRPGTSGANHAVGQPGALMSAAPAVVLGVLTIGLVTELSRAQTRRVAIQGPALSR